VTTDKDVIELQKYKNKISIKKDKQNNNFFRLFSDDKQLKNKINKFEHIKLKIEQKYEKYYMCFNVQQAEQPNVYNVEQSNAQQVEQPNVQHVEQSNVQHVEQSNVQHVEQSNAQQAEQPNAQHVEQYNTQHAEKSNAQQAEQPSIQQPNVQQPNVQQPNVQQAEQSNVQQAEQPNVQHVEQPNVQHTEQPIVRHTEQSNVQHVGQSNTQQMFKCSYCANKYATLNGAKYHEFKFCKNKPRTINKSDKLATQYHKKSIPSPLKRQVWNKYIGEEIGKSKCYCCKLTDITQMSFHAGHVISEKDGGEINATNLRPICQNCNSSMGTMNMNAFIDKYNLHKNN
jgi:hypothetical protein